MNTQGDGTQTLESQQLGTTSIVFMVLAAVAPMGAVVGVIPLSIALGNGTGAPATWLLAGVVLLLFAVGFTAMSRLVGNAGGFYTYVSRGIGRPFGVGASYVAVLAYNAVMISVAGVFALFAREVADSVLGIQLSWQVWIALALVAVALLAWRRIDLSAKVLGVALVLEVLVLLMLDVAILIEQGPSAFTLDVFNPSTVFSGAPGVALLLAFYTFIGFEQTAIYSEEAKDPARTIPRATFIAVGITAAFYILTSWSLIAGYGASQAQQVATDDPAGFAFAANAQFVGGFTNEALQLLVVTSLFASMLSLHNATARYMFALGREGLLPRALARTHSRHHSPYVGTIAQLVIAVAVIVPFAIAGSDPYLELGAPLVGLGAFGVIVLQAAAAFAVIGFFRGRNDPRKWTTVIAPLLGGAGLVAACVLVLSNYSALTGKTSGIVNQLPWLVLLAALIGIAYGLWMRTNQPEKYARIGHSRDEVLLSPLPVPAGKRQTVPAGATTVAR